MRRNWQRILQIDKLWANECSEDDLDRLSAPVHLDTEPNDCGHDTVQNGPEPASHAPYGTTEDCETKMLVRTWPPSDDGDEGSDYRNSDNEAHRLRHTKAEGQEGGAKGPCCRVDACYYPVPGVTLPIPCLAVRRDGNEVSVAPLDGYQLVCVVKV